MCNCSLCIHETKWTSHVKPESDVAQLYASSDEMHALILVWLCSRLEMEPPLELSTTPEVDPSGASEPKEPELSYEANKSGGSTDSLETVDKVDVFHSHLIQPNEVVVSDTVFVAETVEPAIVPDTTLYGW